MNAVEARKKAEKIRTVRSYEYSTIQNIIKEKASDGVFEAYLSRSVSDDVVKQLREEDYNVTFENGGMKIKW